MFEGMDPAAIERLSALMSLSAESWIRAGEDLRALVNALSWEGPDAESFAKAVVGAYGQFVALAETLRGAARTLEEHAAEQRRASSFAG